MRTFTAQDYARIAAALRIAVDVYRDDARGIREVSPRVGDQFMRQAEEALRLAIEIEDSEE